MRIGLLATTLTSVGPPLIRMAVFALVYPFVRDVNQFQHHLTRKQFVIQALHSRPPTPRSSLLPSTPSPHSSHPSSPSEGGNNLNNPFFASTSAVGSSQWKLEPKLPIFFFARFALEGLAWLEQAVGRERRPRSRSSSGKERPGKRLM